MASEDQTLLDLLKITKIAQNGKDFPKKKKQELPEIVKN